MLVRVTEENWKKILLYDALITSQLTTLVIIFAMGFDSFCR